MDYLIQFDNLEWEQVSPAVRQKIFSARGARLRLAEFSPGFTEPDWCRKAHWGYLLEGRLTIDFNGREVTFAAGEGLTIPSGEEHRHKAAVQGEQPVLLILFEQE